MKFYDQYPMLRPYVGDRFYNRRTPSILLIGESHYLPDGSTQHLSPEAWYSGSSETLNQTEREWISTAEIIRNSRKNDFRNDGHSIWKESFQIINEFGPAYADYKCIADDLAFYNFFLRPALRGQSLVVTGEDAVIANEAFLTHYETLKPTAIAFLSMKAHHHWNQPRHVGVPVVAAPHPTCRWWNRAAKRYENRKGRDILADLIKDIKWKEHAGASDCGT